MDFEAYKEKLKDALTMVSSLGPLDRCKAIEHWNEVATDFQTLVNTCDFEKPDDQGTVDEVFPATSSIHDVGIDPPKDDDRLVGPNGNSLSTCPRISSGDNVDESCLNSATTSAADDYDQQLVIQETIEQALQIVSSQEQTTDQDQAVYTQDFPSLSPSIITSVFASIDGALSPTRTQVDDAAEISGEHTSILIGEELQSDVENERDVQVSALHARQDELNASVISSDRSSQSAGQNEPAYETVSDTMVVRTNNEELFMLNNDYSDLTSRANSISGNTTGLVELRAGSSYDTDLPQTFTTNPMPVGCMTSFTNQPIVYLDVVSLVPIVSNPETTTVVERHDFDADIAAEKVNLTCTHCGKSGFSTKGNLKRHIMKHDDGKRFHCEHCPSKFTEKKSLKIHMRKHTGERPYKCDLCDRGFAQAGTLKIHKETHFEKFKFECDLCPKKFRQRNALDLHKKRHAGIKDLECSECKTKFLTKTELDRHVMTHTGERPFICQTCQKGFTRQQTLNEHINRHVSRKPYSCKECEETFFERGCLLKHMKRHQGVMAIRGKTRKGHQTTTVAQNRT